MVPISDWLEIAYFAKLISNIFLVLDIGHDLRHGIWNDPVCLVCQHIISEFSVFTDYETENKTCVDIEYE